MNQKTRVDNRTGTQDPPGPQGPQGERGLTGATGMTGLQGPIGVFEGNETNTYTVSGNVNTTGTVSNSLGISAARCNATDLLLEGGYQIVNVPPTTVTTLFDRPLTSFGSSITNGYGVQLHGASITFPAFAFCYDLP